MKTRSCSTYMLMAAAVLLGSQSVVRAAPIFLEGFSGSTLMASNPAAPTATSTDYAVLSTKNATGSTIGSTLDLTIPATSSGLAEAQALFTTTPVTVGDGETLRMQITYTSTHLLDGGGTSAGTQFITFGLYNSGGVYPVPGGQMANGLLGNATNNFQNGYAKEWKGYVGQIANASGTSKILTRDPQIGTDNEVQDTVFADGVTGGYDTPDGTDLALGSSLPLDDGVYTMILDVSKTGSVMQIDQYLYQGAGTSGSLLYSLTATYESFLDLYDTFDSLAFGYRGRNTDGEAIHMNISSLEIGMVDTSIPSVTGLGDQSVVETESITLAPVIAGGTPLFIQWKSNSVDLVGETNATLELPLIQLAQDGTVYSVAVSNAYGTASGSMTLTVTPAPPSTGLYNLQLNYGGGSAAYVGAAHIGSSNDVWNNPVWDGVVAGNFDTNLFTKYIVDSGGANHFGVSANLTSLYNDGAGWNNSGTFNRYTSRDQGSPNPIIMERVEKIDSSNPLTLSLSGMPTNAACTIYVYGSGNKYQSGLACSLAATNQTIGGISSTNIIYDTNTAVVAATARDVTLATSQGQSWEVLTGTTDASGNLTIHLDPPGFGNAGNQVFPVGVQIQVALPVTGPSEGPVIQSIAVAGSAVTLTWTDQGVGTYTIQRKTDLTATNWTDVLPGLPAGLGATNVTASGAAQEYYQIKGE